MPEFASEPTGARDCGGQRAGCAMKEDALLSRLPLCHSDVSALFLHHPILSAFDGDERWGVNNS